jgi:hypothetical protein
MSETACIILSNNLGIRKVAARLVLKDLNFTQKDVPHSHFIRDYLVKKTINQASYLSDTILADFFLCHR